MKQKNFKRGINKKKCEKRHVGQTIRKYDGIFLKNTQTETKTNKLPIAEHYRFLGSKHNINSIQLLKKMTKN